MAKVANKVRVDIYISKLRERLIRFVQVSLIDTTFEKLNYVIIIFINIVKTASNTCLTVEELATSMFCNSKTYLDLCSKMLI